MQSGDLKNHIDIQAVTRVSDSMGGWTNTYTTIHTVWAAIWPVKGSELFQNGQAVINISHQIRIRYRENIRPSYRIKFGTRYFSIVSIINPNTDYKALDLMCKEVLV